MPEKDSHKKGEASDLRSGVIELFQKAGEDNLPRLASSFSFFAILSLAPFLVLAVTVGAYFLGSSQTTAHILKQAQEVGGTQVRDYVGQIIANARRPGSSAIASVLSLCVTFFSASNLFLNLDDAVNTIWKRPHGKSFVTNYIVTRLVAFFSVMLFGSILLGWLALDTAMGYLAKSNSSFPAWQGVSFLVAAVFFSIAFTFTLRALPRGVLTLRDALPGGILTGVGFAVSKFLLSYYFQRLSGVYTAAGGIVVLLLWMYYSCIIYFFGVELTYTYSHRWGSLRGTVETDTPPGSGAALQPS